MNEIKLTKLKRRRNLLPWWIKFFCWVFIITGVLSLVVLALSIFGYQAALAIYGFDAENNYPYNFIIIMVVFIFNLIVSLNLWFEKNKAMLLSEISAIFGILICITSMIIDIINTKFTFRLEIILLILFFFQIRKIKKEWLTTPQTLQINSKN